MPQRRRRLAGDSSADREKLEQLEAREAADTPVAVDVREDRDVGTLGDLFAWDRFGEIWQAASEGALGEAWLGAIGELLKSEASPRPAISAEASQEQLFCSLGF